MFVEDALSGPAWLSGTSQRGGRAADPAARRADGRRSGAPRRPRRSQRRSGPRRSASGSRAAAPSISRPGGPRRAPRRRHARGARGAGAARRAGGLVKDLGLGLVDFRCTGAAGARSTSAGRSVRAVRTGTGSTRAMPSRKPLMTATACERPLRPVRHARSLRAGSPAADRDQRGRPCAPPPGTCTPRWPLTAGGDAGATCYGALAGSWQEAERLRAIDHREVSRPGALRRFLPAPGVRARRHGARRCDVMLIDAHRAAGQGRRLPAAPPAAARAAGAAPPPRRRVELRLQPHRAGYPGAGGCAICSRPSWSRTRWAGASRVRDIFREAFRRSGLAPAPALFVGDRADIDVVGAQAMGMDVAWINRDGEALPAGAPAPDHEITRSCGSCPGCSAT